MHCSEVDETATDSANFFVRHPGTAANGFLYSDRRRGSVTWSEVRLPRTKARACCRQLDRETSRTS